MIATALVIAAFILFILAAVGVPAGRYSLLAAGLACWVLSQLVGRL
jgi:hypothetical protein